MDTVAKAPRSPRRPALGYVAATVLTTVSFVLLQYIGNQTPFAVVVEKIAAEFEAEPVAWGTRHQLGHSHYEYCYITSGVLVDSLPTTPLHGALLPHTMEVGCPNLQRFVIAAKEAMAIKNALAEIELPHIPHIHIVPRQWFGSKALYAIGLRFLTIHEYHEFIRKLTYAAYAALALAVALLGWRAVAVASPLLIFGAALSGIEYLSDVPKGTAYAWAIFSAALVALLLRCPAVAASTTRLFCFVAGMVAGYLWLFGGANFVAAILIGLMAWLRYAPLAPRTRAARSAACVFAHTAGFVLSVGLAQVVRLGDAAAWIGTVAKDIARILSPDGRDDQSKDIVTWTELLPFGIRETTLLIDATMVALGTALLVAGYRAWRRDWGAMQELLWIGALGLAWLVHFLLPNDLPYAAARLWYLPLALCWCALAAMLLRTPRPVYARLHSGPANTDHPRGAT